MENSVRNLVKKLKKNDIGKFINGLTEKELITLFYDWEVWARDTQLEPAGIWSYWLILAGRGWG